MPEFRLPGMKISEGKGKWEGNREMKREGMVWLIVKKSSWEEEKENLGNEREGMVWLVVKKSS